MAPDAEPSLSVHGGPPHSLGNIAIRALMVVSLALGTANRAQMVVVQGAQRSLQPSRPSRV